MVEAGEIHSETSQRNAGMRPALQSLYDDLCQVAGERSSEKRVELLRKVTDLFLNGFDAHTSPEHYLFNEIIDKIVDQIAQEAKARIAANIATLPGFPHAAVRKLANDADIEVARPVIRGSPMLTDEDLVAIAEGGSQAHLNAIASRNRLSEKVTDVLIVRGDREVVQTVSANHGARFSAQGVDRLLEKAQEDVDLRELLVERPDLSQSSVDKLLPLVSEGLLIKLAERGYDVRGKMSPGIVERVREKFTKALGQRCVNIREVSVFVRNVSNGVMTLDQAVSDLVEAERLLDVATVLGHFMKLDRNQVFSRLVRGELQSLMMMFRALDLNWSTLEGVLALRAKKRRMRFVINDGDRRDYEAIDVALAQRTMRFLYMRRALGAAGAAAS